MGFFTGRTGALFLSETPFTTAPDYKASGEGDQVLKLRDWSLDTTLELLETTTADTAVKSYTPGVVSATGSATILYYRREGTTSTEPGRQFHSVINKIMKTGTGGVTASSRVGMVLRVGTTIIRTKDSEGVVTTSSDLKDDIAFNAYITSASIQVSTGELSSIAVQFTVDGPFLERIDK